MAKMTLDIPDPQENEEDATERQRQFIRALMREAGASGLPEESIQQLGKWQASAVISQLKEFKSEVEDARTGAPVEGSGGSALRKPIGKPLLWLIVIAVIVWLIL